MWYFSWLLGLSLACAFGVLNALWLEIAPGDQRPEEEPPAASSVPDK